MLAEIKTAAVFKNAQKKEALNNEEFVENKGFVHLRLVIKIYKNFNLRLQ